MKRILNLIPALVAALVCIAVTSGCHKVNPDPDTFTHVAIYYGCGYNNLSDGMKRNVVKELASGDIPERASGNAMLAFCHNTATSQNYVDGNCPVLLRIYKEDGVTVIDTVKTYPMMTVSASASTLSSVLSDIKEKYKSDSYGFIFSSHASGWLPIGYKSSSSENSRVAAPSSLGAQFRGSSSNSTEIELKDFAAAFPYPLDYIILDCCLAGSVEVAWELRKVCDRIVFSPTEILAGGYDYNNMAKRLFSKPADLEGICTDHYDKYAGTSNNYSTTTLVDCSEIEKLAEVMGSIISAHRQAFNQLKEIAVSGRTVQRYFYQSTYYTYFYDLRHIAVTIGASESELAELDAALKKFVVFEKHTDYFLDGLQLRNVCGVSMYIPYNQWYSLNSYYNGLGWNNMVKVVDN